MGPGSFSSSSQPLAGYRRCCPPNPPAWFCSRDGEARRRKLAQTLKKTSRHSSALLGPLQGGGSLTMPACPLPAAQEGPPWLHPDPRWTRLVPGRLRRAPEMLTRLVYILEGSPGASRGFPEKEPTPSQMAHSSRAGGPFLSANLLSPTIVWG